MQTKGFIKVITIALILVCAFYLSFSFVANRIENIHERAIVYHDTVEPHMDAIRYEADKLELIVEDGLWTLPKYRELLFIR